MAPLDRVGSRRSAVALALALTAAGGTLAACSSTPAAVTTSARTVASRVIPAPAGLIAGAVPQPDGSMWVLAGDAQAKTLTQIDLSNGQKVATVPVSSAADAVAQSTTGLLAVGTATSTSGSVELRNGSSGTLSSTVAVGAPVRGLTFGADGVTLYVLDGSASGVSVTPVNSANGQTLASVGCPKDAIGLQSDPTQSQIWTVQSGENVQGTSLQTGKSLGIVPLDNPGIALAFPPSGTSLFALKGSGSVWNIAQISAGSTIVSRTLPAAAYSVGLVASADGSTLYDLVGTAALGNIQVIKVPAAT